MRGSIRVVVVGIALALVAAACSSNSSSGGSATEGQQGGTFSFYNGEPNHLIPQNDYESAGTQAFQGLWTRLVDFDPTTFKPVPAQADSIDVSSDGLTYTIKIKPGWTFHDGTPVTAQSYVDAWNYTAYGPNGYILNFFFDKIEGYDALNPSSGAGGAYQMLPSTYQGLGGKYGTANKAPKWEQDRLAAKLWAGGRGAGNWECAK